MSIHSRATVVDSLIVSDWRDDVFDAIRAGGISACNATMAVWENYRETSENIAAVLRSIADYPDKLAHIRKTADIQAAKDKGQLGLILGFQNAAPIEDRPDFVHLFKALGVGVIQLTYNNQNLAGSGAFESRDGGLTDFGRILVEEMNRAGIAIDLSHVGIRTTDEVLEYSARPPCFTHANPRALRHHVRCKSDEALQKMADKGGYIGAVLSPVFMPDGANSAIEDIVAVTDYMINLVGEDQIGIGTDMTQGHGEEFWRWIMKINGTGPEVEITPPDKMGMVIRDAADWGQITAAFEKHGYSDDLIEKIIGANFINYLARAWNEVD